MPSGKADSRTSTQPQLGAGGGSLPTGTDTSCASASFSRSQAARRTATRGRLAFGLLGLVEMGMFLALLVLGFVYVWKKGALEWE